MKHVYLMLLVCIIFFGCNTRQKQQDRIDEPLVFTMPEDSIETATAVIWIDKHDKKNHDKMKTRAAKAKVLVTEDGKVEVIAFIKNYRDEVQKYINHKLQTFSVAGPMMENDYIKPGEQFMQIRYSEYLMKECDFVYK